MSVRNDAQLLEAIADGDRDALRTLHDRHAAWVALRLRRRCSNPDVVAEAVQDTFVAVWTSAARWDGRGEPAAWIWGIAIRRLIGVLRSRDRWNRDRPTETVPESDVVTTAEDQVLHRRRTWRPGRSPRAAVAGAACGCAGDGPRRTHDTRGGATARHPGRHGQDPDDAGKNSDERSTGMSNTWMGDPDPSETAWHAPRSLIDRFAVDPGGVDSAVAASFEAHLVACASLSRCGDRTCRWRGSRRLVASGRIIDRHAPPLDPRAGDDPARRVGLHGTSPRRHAGADPCFARLRRHPGCNGCREQVGSPIRRVGSSSSHRSYLSWPSSRRSPRLPIRSAKRQYRRRCTASDSCCGERPWSSSAVFMVLGAADLAVGDLDAPVIAWLLPALALPVGALALGTWLRAEVAATTLGVGWMVVVLGVRWMDGLQTDFADTTTFAPPGQVAAFAPPARCRRGGRRPT